MNEFLDACRNGNIEFIKEHLPQVDPSTRDNWAIRWAAKNGHKDVVTELLKDSRVNPSAEDNFAIKWAVVNGHQDVIKLLLEDYRVDPSAEDNWAIRFASQHCHKDVVELLEQHQYKLDNEKYNEMAKL